MERALPVAAVNVLVAAAVLMQAVLVFPLQLVIPFILT